MKLTAAARAKAWDPARGLFLDSPEAKLFSQQTNTMAVLVDAVPAAEQRALMERVLGDKTLVQATYYYGFYVLEALRKAGLADRYVEQLAALAADAGAGPHHHRGEPGAHPLRLPRLERPPELRPARDGARRAAGEPGFRSVRIAPSLGPLKRAEGRIPHPRGDIEVRLVRSGELTASAER